jgi:cytochrome c biogenesis protein CcdA
MREMIESLVGTVSALWLGVLTSISPCPLATNIAAISFIGRRVEKPRHVLLSGLLYTLGRAVTYSFLGILLVTSLLSAPYLSHSLQKYMNKILGPVLILAGMFLLELIALNIGGRGMSDKMRERIEKMGLGGAGLLGIVFALSFCPVSAALFFGSLIPLAVQSNSGVVLPSLYGLGTALPAVVVAIFIALGVHSVGKAFDKITQVEWWARRITGVVFVVIGIYLSLAYIFRVLP